MQYFILKKQKQSIFVIIIFVIILLREKVHGVFENYFVTAQNFWTKLAVSNPL